MFLRLLSTSLFSFIFFSMNSHEILATAIGSSSFPFTNETDRQALLAIKALIPGDPLHAFSSWNHSIHFCSWQGVTCGHRHQRVIMLDLSSLELVGIVSPHMGNLTFLRVLKLGNNSFHGRIPQEIGRLFRLQNLSLASNSFRGAFPTNLTRCLGIKSIHLRNNNLVGNIPAEIGSLSNLLQLVLGENHFSGTIPPSIGNLSALRILSLEYNKLEESIPFELGQLSRLEYFRLSFNNLSGVVPTSLYNVSSINRFSIVGNLFQGSLPLSLGLTLPNLQEFLVGRNRFYGAIPSSIANASGLVKIDISSNSFTGPIPMNFGNLYNLQKFSCFGNKLGSGKVNEVMNFLESLSNCSNLESLVLGINRFKGWLTPSIANLTTKLIELDLGDNYISGSIPLTIGNLVNLRKLILQNNMLVGSIPNSIGQLYKLEEMSIYGNNISGYIPFSIGNISRLSILILAENMLEGSIPVSLGNCTNLQGLDLGYNHLAGAIPEQVVGLSSLSIGLFLDHNRLTGLLPIKVGSLRNLGKLVLAENKLSGEIPITLGSCEVLEFLYMEGNLFEGSIPTSFKELKGIQVLDLSRNNLSGQIPRFLGEFTSIQNLNLSYNMFEGEVPNEAVFKNSSLFSIVGNNKICGKIRGLQLPACPSKVVEKKNRISNGGVMALVVTPTVVLLLVCVLAIHFRIISSSQEVSLVSPSQNQYPKLSYGELLRATNEFSSTHLIGKGRYGSVYKGILNSVEQIVAVKVLNLQEHAANKSFTAECEALRAIRHRNLIKIITSCSTIDFKGNDFKALVFEFMANGSLDSWLHPSLSQPPGPTSLNFIQRLNIAIDVASALDYLHHHCEMTIIHCDLKPSNILLDDDLCAKVADFGLARILSSTTNISSHHQSSSSGIRGTIGYVAPEYGMGGEVSTKGDIYSYGILLLEIFTGKRPTDNMFTDNFSLHNYAKMFLPDRVMEIADPQIILEEEEEPNKTTQNGRVNTAKIDACMVSIIQNGVLCSAELPSERMDVKDVLAELLKIRNKILNAQGKRCQDGTTM